ncbi:helix-turn-helix domain-containing protein [Desulfobacter latus]|uniref:Helix-turn-helix domain-containing protein n=1 Tax=Desulfobacter latus TaxID=2292 RepID=A0A850TBL5_9BACT|nr:helix-turn-helix domain-containing protein [Desulfobacter latus]NWH06825.1 helix-turn-helix domain-containing protein [Desulfobacter latus]
MNIIIPANIFTNPFAEILNGIHGILTKTERKLLILFERYCYKDGQIFPKIKTLARKLGISTRQVQRLIASLVEKGFLKVVPASLIDRHLYGKGNHYHLLDHPAYHQDEKISSEMSPEMSSETVNHTIYNNKEIKTKSGFDVFEWLEKNKKKHAQAIIDALNALTARWPAIKKPFEYAQKIVDVQSGNYNAADHEAQAKQEAAEINAGYEKISEHLGLGLNLSGKRHIKEETYMEIDARRKEQLNRLFDMFPQKQGVRLF